MSFPIFFLLIIQTSREQTKFEKNNTRQKKTIPYQKGKEYLILVENQKQKQKKKRTFYYFN